MTINELKNSIENRSVGLNNIIFVYKDTDFVALQYINEIAKINSKSVTFVHSQNELPKNSVFEFYDDTSVYVYSCEEYAPVDNIMPTGVFVITKKCSDKNIINIPKLEDWNFKDYAHSIVGLDKSKNLDLIVDRCGSDIYKLNNELSKILLFEPKDREKIIKEFLDNKQIPLSPTETIIDFINAIMNEDKDKISYIYKNIGEIDIEPLGVATMLYNKLRKMLLVCQPEPSEKNTGMKSGEIYYIKKDLAKHGVSWTVDKFKKMCYIDYKLKSGEVPSNKLLDYILVNMLGDC